MQKRQRKRPPIPRLIDEINRLDDVAREKLAQNCGTSVGNLRQIAYGFGGVLPKISSLLMIC